MTNSATYTFETPSYLDRIHDPFLEQLHRVGRDPKILSMKFLYATPASDTEIRTSFTNELDGIATPVKVNIKSSDNTNDKVGGTGAITVAIFGISGTSATATDFKLQEEVVTLTGTTAVTTTKFYKRIIGTRTVTAGSGKDPAGNLTVHEVGGTTNTYCTQGAGTNCSINARVYVPTGYNLHMERIKARRLPTVNTATGNLTDGGVITLKRDGSLLTQVDNQKFPVLPLNLIDEHPCVDITGSDDDYVTLSVQAIDTDVTTVDLYIRVTYIIYATSTTARGF